jgi:hypothetical protein
VLAQEKKELKNALLKKLTEPIHYNETGDLQPKNKTKKFVKIRIPLEWFRYPSFGLHFF